MPDLKEALDKYMADKKELESRYGSLRDKSIAYINTVIASFDIKASELCFDGAKKGCAKKAKIAKPRAKVEKNYKAPDGSLWTGRGKAPKAFQVLFDQGHKKEEYYIGPAK